jgi:hypothetical protein
MTKEEVVAETQDELLKKNLWSHTITIYDEIINECPWIDRAELSKFLQSLGGDSIPVGSTKMSIWLTKRIVEHELRGMRDGNGENEPQEGKDELQGASPEDPEVRNEVLG